MDPRDASATKRWIKHLNYENTKYKIINLQRGKEARRSRQAQPLSRTLGYQPHFCTFSCHHVVVMILLPLRWADGLRWGHGNDICDCMNLVICGMWILFGVFGGSKLSMVSSDKIGWIRIALIAVAIVATKMKLHTNLEVHIEARGWRQRVMTCWLALSNRILVSFEGRTTVGSHVPIAPHQLSQICPSLKKGISELHSLNCFIHCHISAA